MITVIADYLGQRSANTLGAPSFMHSVCGYISLYKGRSGNLGQSQKVTVTVVVHLAIRLQDEIVLFLRVQEVGISPAVAVTF